MFDTVFVVMNDLQKQVAELGRCHQCHTVKLRSVTIVAETEWLQCPRCLHIYILEERRLTG